MFGQLHYRSFKEADLPAILRLWEENTDWGKLTEKEWRQWHQDTPSGDAIVIVGEDDTGEIAAAAAGMPATLWIDGREVSATRLSAPILHQKMRLGTLPDENHATVGLLRAHLSLAEDRGVSVMYGLPKHQFLAFFRWLPKLGLPAFQMVGYPCFELDLATADDAHHIAEKGLQVSLVDEFGPEYDDLWGAAVRELPILCGRVRRPRHLAYKIGGHLSLAVRESRVSDLLGFCTFKPGSGLITDVLSRNAESIPVIIDACIQYFCQHRAVAEEHRLSTVKLMESKVLDGIPRRLGFKQSRFRFGFVAYNVDSRLPSELIEPSQWYLTPGD